ncbi:tetratricopeptide repeat protein [Adhaeretor mobilis]|uniref:Tetratricopeptide repeat protein n=1 Tax=Adhaeretor mobilis TaxID=1930276 RepID=A0A517MSV1_9BACT|nr:tetratricopeptide repeat protein [Adhaeretor mobilis]QDS97958.1 Tetratricopeptide repeat protein [Adhaeretor mobilis]
MKTLAVFLALVSVGGFSFSDLWLTQEQKAQRLMDNGDYAASADMFRDPMRQGAAWFRAAEFEKAEQAFARVATAEAEFNRGNCLVMQGKYEPAVERFDRALELRPDWEDAQVNRRIAAERAELLAQTGGDMGDQKIGADDVVFDKNKKPGGQETQTDGDKPLSDSAMQSLWLRRVQTKPADFLKTKFAYQLSASQQLSAGQQAGVNQ